jgi:ppGpp synthetase/RelA/SpoT-type nucleotidyltranferase
LSHDVGAQPALDLGDLDGFLAHPWVKALVPRFRHEEALARQAMRRLTDDLKKLNDAVVGRSLFTSIDGRVKTEDSFFRKLYSICKTRSNETGVTIQILQQFYESITDLTGVRFACPYYDEIEPSIANVRKYLADHCYATQLAEFADKNYLDTGDPRGYRSYHFFVKIPTPTTIYGDSELCLCEVQVRSELQHVWAVKSHDLLYKPGTGWHPTDHHILEDMRQLSNSLRAADQALLSIRDRAQGRSDGQ